MATLEMLEAQQATPEATPAETREPLFNAEQQRAFDRAFKRREKKLRNEYESKLAAAIRDLLQTAVIAQQLLNRAKDRVSREDFISIRTGLQEISDEYGQGDYGTNGGY